MDNQGAKLLAENRAASERTKHIDLKLFFVQDAVEAKQIKLNYVPTEHNVADGFTKAIDSTSLAAHRKVYGMSDLGRC